MFLITNYLSNAVELLAFFTSLLLLKKPIQKEYLPYFWYCLSVIFIESAGKAILLTGHRSNHTLYTFANIYFANMYFYFLLRILQTMAYKKTLRVLLVIYNVFAIINLLFIQQLREANTFSEIVEYIFIVVGCCLYYIEFISIETVISFSETPQFFLITGLFFFSALCGINKVIHRFFAYKSMDVIMKFRPSYHTIICIANACLYLLFSVAFLLIWNKKKSLAYSSR